LRVAFVELADFAVKAASYCSKMSVTSPAKPQVIAIESVPRQYSYAALAFMQIASGGSAGSILSTTH